jgi:hypothetical protein
MTAGYPSLAAVMRVRAVRVGFYRVEPCRGLRRSRTRPVAQPWLIRSRLFPGFGSALARCLRRMRLLRRFSVRRPVRAQGLQLLGWVAIAALVVGLAVAASILAPWRFKFAVDSRELYIELYERAAAEAEADTLGWLASAGYGYQELRERNASRVGLMSTLSGALGLLMVLQTLAWLAALAVD